MAPSPNFGQLDAAAAGVQPPQPESFFRIAVLADFSGRHNQGTKAGGDELAGQKGHRIDRDNFDEVLARLEPALTLPLPKSRKKAKLAFRSLDDFNPNEIHDKVDAFLDCDSAEEKSALMNALLHHADFQALESAWLGLEWLLRRVLKGGPRVEVVVFDLSFTELQDDLAAGDDLAESGLYRLLARNGEEDKAWGLIVGAYRFEVSAPHAELLGRLAKVAAALGAPLLADAAPQLLDAAQSPDAEAQEAWAQLRALPEAAALGLALPRFLLRLPYGERTRSIDNFAYEEFTGPKDSCYLWGPAAFAAAALVGQSFAREGWAFRPGKPLDLDSMHIHTYRDEDDDDQVTLAEAWLTRPAAEKLVELGIMPILCVKNKDAVQFVHFSSLAQPPRGERTSALQGRWGQEGMAPVARSAKPPVTVGVSLGNQVASGRVPDARRSEPVATPDEDAGEAPADEVAPDEDAPVADDVATDEAPAAEEEMDPELAALMAQLEGSTSADDAPATASAGEEAAAPADEMDPELAALMAQLEGSTSAEEAPAAEEAAAPADDGTDPELAALMAQLEGDSTAAAAPTEEPEPPASDAPADDLDPELAALMAQIEAPADETADAPAAAPTVAETADAGGDPQAQVEALGGAAALEDLGWPMFVPAFAEDYARQLRILESRTINQAVAKEVKDLVKKCGGYAALAEHGVTEDMGLNAQLAALRQLKNERDRQKDLRDPELEAMAKAYGANLKLAKGDVARLQLVAQLKEFDKWASDPRHQDAVAALEGTKFAERRQAQLEDELNKLGGDAAFDAWVADHPADAEGGATAEGKVVLLRALREYNRLGGEDAYRSEAAGSDDGDVPLTTRLERLRAIRAAQE